MSASSYLYINPEKILNSSLKEWVRNITVAHIGPLWLPLPREDRNYGGVEDVVLNNIKALESFRIKKQIVFGHPANKRMEHIFKRLKVYTPDFIATSNDLLEILRTDPYTATKLEEIYVLQAYKKIAANKKDITIVHDHTNAGRSYSLWFSKYVRPVVRTEHGPLKYPYISHLEQDYYSLFKNRRSIGFISISKNQRSQMPYLPWIGTNYNGIDLDDFQFSEKKDKFLLYLGRVTRDKGVHNAVKVALKLSIPLIIAGSIEEKPESVKYFNDEVSPFIDNKNIIHFENGVNAVERKNLLKKANALLMLNEWDEPFGMVMPEALASGTPIIGTAKGSIPEIVGKNCGFIVKNTAQATKAVTKILEGEYSAKACRVRVERYFSKEAMAARNLKLYRQQSLRFENMKI